MRGALTCIYAKRNQNAKRKVTITELSTYVKREEVPERVGRTQIQKRDKWISYNKVFSLGENVKF